MSRNGKEETVLAARLQRELERARCTVQVASRKLKTITTAAGDTSTDVGSTAADAGTPQTDPGHVSDLSVTSSSSVPQSSPAGRLRIQNTPSGPQYFQVTGSDDNIGRYLSKKNAEDMQVAATLAQREYYHQLQKLTDDWIAGLNRVEKAIKKLPDCTPDNLYSDNLPRRNLVTPCLLSDNEFIAQWQAHPYRGKAFDTNLPVIMTNRGERVRSKSEKIIADRLAELHIPYRYECPIKLTASRTYSCELDDGTLVPIQKSKTVTLYPDFTILAPDRTEIILEHFGLLDMPAYASSFVEKIRLYADNGYYSGENLVFSTEMDTLPLDMRTLEAALNVCLERHA